MTMRLIDADELMEIVAQEGRVTVDDILCAVTVEAAPVVHCKDCDFYFRNVGTYCTLYRGLVMVSDETFCSHGRRREY